MSVFKSYRLLKAYKAIAKAESGRPSCDRACSNSDKDRVSDRTLVRIVKWDDGTKLEAEPTEKAMACMGRVGLRRNDGMSRIGGIG